MSDLAHDTSPKATQLVEERPDIPLANGDSLTPRRRWAGKRGISDKTARKLNLPTTYVGNVAYVPDQASTEILAGRIQYRNQPPRRRTAVPPDPGIRPGGIRDRALKALARRAQQKD
jgi:hypothetical protein